MGLYCHHKYTCICCRYWFKFYVWWYLLKYRLCLSSAMNSFLRCCVFDHVMLEYAVAFYVVHMTKISQSMTRTYIIGYWYFTFVIKTKGSWICYQPICKCLCKISEIKITSRCGDLKLYFYCDYLNNVLIIYFQIKPVICIVRWWPIKT